jgi:hypothetical protein
MVYGTQITKVNGVYKPTNITGGPHIVGFRESYGDLVGSKRGNQLILKGGSAFNDHFVV